MTTAGVWLAMAICEAPLGTQFRRQDQQRADTAAVARYNGRVAALGDGDDDVGVVRRLRSSPGWLSAQVGHAG